MNAKKHVPTYTERTVTQYLFCKLFGEAYQRCSVLDKITDAYNLSRGVLTQTSLQTRIFSLFVLHA